MWTINRFPAFWLLPALLPVALMTIYPIGHAFWTSLHSVMLLFPDEPFVGLDNYERVITSNYFQDALQQLPRLYAVCRADRRHRRHADRAVPAAPLRRVADRSLGGAAAVGAARRDQRGAVDLGVPSELRRPQRHPARPSPDRQLDPLAHLAETRADRGRHRPCLDADSIRRRADHGGAFGDQLRDAGGCRDRLPQRR